MEMFLNNNTNPYLNSVHGTPTLSTEQNYMQTSSADYGRKSMNLSQENPVLESFSASFEHELGDAVTPPKLPPSAPLALADFFGHRKKLRDPNTISFSSPFRPGPHKHYNQSLPHTCHHQISSKSNGKSKTRVQKRGLTF